jgi:hypothetical protein
MPDEYFPAPGPANPAQVARIGNELRVGHLDNLRTVTLAAGATTTTLNDPRIRPTTVPLLVPRSSAAAAVTWWLASRGRQSLVLGHDAPGSAVEFSVVLLG